MKRSQDNLIGQVPQAEGHRGAILAEYVAGAHNRVFPDHIINAAKVALIDFVGVAVGSVAERAVVSTRTVARTWNASGPARIFCAGLTNPALAALVNGTMAHCQDYDDTHIGGGGHIAAPVMSTALAVGAEAGNDEAQILKGFITGYEVMARLGAGGIYGIGRGLQARGFHPTGINGAVGAAAAVAAIRGYDATQAAHALSVAATSGAGYVASFGSDSKPYHAGRAAMSGILAADLARTGFTAANGLFERENGMLDALVQDRNVQVPDLDFSASWELLNNGYKPFACCRATHASIQAGHQLAGQIRGRRVTRVTTRVHHTAPYSAGKMNPQTPMECKFSVAFCLAAALCGYDLTAADFNDATLRDPDVQAILPLVELHPKRDQPQFEAYVDVWLEDGTSLRAETLTFLGHPDNPMSAQQMYRKFQSLVAPVFGEAMASEILEQLENFERPGAFACAMALLSG